MAMVNGYIYIFCVVVGKVRAGEDVISFDKHLYYIYIYMYSDLCGYM